MAIYTNTSPWVSTPQNNFYLETLRIRSIPSEPDDFRYTIENQYRHRPDLLAHDVYGNAKLWWVFVQRNMDILKDPIYDFIPGRTIFLPKQTNLEQYLGV